MHSHSRTTLLSPFGRKTLAVLVFGAAFLAAGLAMAQPGQNQEAWSAAPRDRAGLAVVMGQIDGSISANGGSGAGASATTLVCGGGGGGASSATANSTCVILNNSTGSSIGIGQDSAGDQSATSTTSTSATTNTMSSALSGLVGGN